MERGRKSAENESDTRSVDRMGPHDVSERVPPCWRFKKKRSFCRLKWRLKSPASRVERGRKSDAKKESDSTDYVDWMGLWTRCWTTRIGPRCTMLVRQIGPSTDVAQMTLEITARRPETGLKKGRTSSSWSLNNRRRSTDPSRSFRNLALRPQICVRLRRGL